MEFKNTVEIIDKMNELRSRSNEIIDIAEKEERELTNEEAIEIERNNETIDSLQKQLKQRKAELLKRSDEEKDETEEETKEEDTNEEETNEETNEETPDETEEDTNEEKNTNKRNMNLIKTFRNALAGQPQEVNMRAITVKDSNGATVDVDTKSTVSPLIANSVIFDLGATVYNGLGSNTQIPVLGNATAAWMGEKGTTAASSASLSRVLLTPHILKVMIPVSHTLLMQDNGDFEATLTKAMADALQAKFESTIFSAAAANTTTDAPAGMLNGLTTKGVLDTFAKIAGVEADVESAGVNPDNIKWLVNPSAKAAYRALAKGENVAGNVFENGAIDGTEAKSSGNVAAKTVICGDFSKLAVGIWDTVRIETITDSTYAGQDQVLFCVTMYVDAKRIQDGAFAYGTYVA